MRGECATPGERRHRGSPWRRVGAQAIATMAWVLAASPGIRAAEPTLQVHTASGWVEGERISDGVAVFRGIPFAAPPVGPLRWRAPMPAVPWEGTRPAKAFGPDCIQPAPATIGAPPPNARDAPRSRAPGQSENCLTLNIWTKTSSRDARLPVMLWIYGGGFQAGSGAIADYDGAHFARSGVVLVTINYRVGVLGFLVHPELTAEAPYHSSGNYGLLDQVAALGWVQKNIAAFGGDPTRVTIFGESAGSTAINILHASPLGRGLFARVIGESTSQMDAASGLLGRLSLQQAERYGQDFATSVGATSLEALRRLPAEALQKAGRPFWPLDPDGYVLPEEVYAAFERGHQNDVPTLVGANSAEGVNLRVPWIHPETPDEQAQFRGLYPNADDPQVDSDVVAWQMRSWATLQARSGHAPAYLYLFDHGPPGDDRPGLPLHGAEIPYVFRNFNLVPRAWTEADRRLGDRMAAYWVNFARNGDPNGAGLPPWPALRPGTPQLMRFDADAHATVVPRPEAFAYDDAYFAHRREAPPPAPNTKDLVNLNLSGNGPALAASVPDLALDPRDPQHVEVVWRTVSLNDSPEMQTWVCHRSSSHDGGQHFTDQVLDWNMAETPRCNAPYVDIGANGEIYIGATLAGGSGRPAVGRAVLRRSTDGGRSWSATIDVIGTDTPERFEANPAVPMDAILTPWDGARGVVDRDTGRIFVSGGYPAPPGGKDHSQRFYSASEDGGRSWGPIRAYGSADWPQRWDSHIVAAHGELALAYIGGSVPRDGITCPCVVFATSGDGGATLKRHFVAAVRQLDTLVHYPPVAPNPKRKGSYVIALVSEDGKQLQLLSTVDDGASWVTSPVTAPENVVKVTRPALAYAPDGTLVVMYRGAHEDQSFDEYIAAGADPAQLHAAARLTQQSSQVPVGLLTHYAVRGDFINVIAAEPGAVHAVWTDWRSGSEAQVYYGRVPMARLLAAPR